MLVKLKKIILIAYDSFKICNLLLLLYTMTSKEILQHCNDCKDIRTSERHDMIYPEIQEMIHKSDEKTSRFKEDSVKIHNELWNTLNLNTQAMADLKELVQKVERTNNEWMKEIKEIIKEWFRDVNDKFDKLWNMYATKEELKSTDKEVSRLENILSWIWKGAVWFLSSSFIALLIYIYLIWK